MADIDIVVVEYHTPDDLRRFVGSCAPLAVEWTLTTVSVEQDEPTVPVLDGRCTYVDNLSSVDNIGYARACNWGAYEGDSPVIGFFNADVTLTPGAIEHCLELFQQPDVAVVGPRQVDSRHRLTHAGIFGGNTGAKPRAWHERDRGQHVDIEDATSVSGSAYLVRRSVWHEMADCPIYRQIDPGSLGGFLRTPHYFEETWFSYHVREHGYRVVYDGQATIHHEWHQASPVGGWAERQFKRSQKQFREACDAHGIDHD